MAFEIKNTALTTPVRQAPTGGPRRVETEAAPGVAGDRSDVTAKPAPGPTTAELVARLKGEIEKTGTPGEPAKTFGHTGGLKLSLIQKQPIWADDRTPIKPEEWAQMPQHQRESILAMLPTDMARQVHLSNMDPEVVKARAALKQLGAAAYKGFFNYLEKQAPNPPKP